MPRSFLIRLNTFINYKDKDNPDFEFSNLISKKYDTKHHVVEVNDELQFKTLNELIKYMDEPIDSAIIASF